MKRVILCAVVVVSGVWATAGHAVTIEYVPVGDPGNVDDTHGDTSPLFGEIRIPHHRT